MLFIVLLFSNVFPLAFFFYFAIGLAAMSCFLRLGAIVRTQQALAAQQDDAERVGGLDGEPSRALRCSAHCPVSISTFVG